MHGGIILLIGLVFAGTILMSLVYLGLLISEPPQRAPQRKVGQPPQREVVLPPQAAAIEVLAPINDPVRVLQYLKELCPPPKNAAEYVLLPGESKERYSDLSRYFERRRITLVESTPPSDRLLTIECLSLLARDDREFSDFERALGPYSIDMSDCVGFRTSDLTDFTREVNVKGLSVLTPILMLYGVWLALRRGFTFKYPSFSPAIGMDFMGGLGNQLFQMAALDHISQIIQRPTAIASRSESGVYDDVFRHWKYLPRDLVYPITWNEPRLSYSVADIPLSKDENIRLHGYFQDYRYVDTGFLASLALPRPKLEKYPEVIHAVFIHVRGGDYVGSSTHHVPLEAYYTRAIAAFPPSTLFYVFTNDIAYAQAQPWLNTIRYRWIDEPTVDSLVLMGACGGGGICANSSFSWWGARLNPRRLLTMPDQWYLDPQLDSSGYYFPGVLKIPVSDEN